MAGFTLLGTVEAHGCAGMGSVKITGTAQQTLLVALLVSEGKVVPTEILIDELWGTTPPGKVDNALQAQVSRLRKQLDKVDDSGGFSARLAKKASGYSFDMNGVEVDVMTLLQGVGAIHSQLGPDIEVVRMVKELRELLAMWHEPIFGGLEGGPICRQAAEKFREGKGMALTLLYQMELRAGGHARVIPELFELSEQEKPNEQHCILLMRALYAVGRQVDALSVFRKFRTRLDQEYGLEPSPMVQQYEQAILNHDRNLLSDDRNM